VQQSSDSVATLAAALAKAQAQLVNPEKSLTATIRTGRPGETERTFRYAPLSSGLEIIRKTLSAHEIAVMQTTAIDLASRILNLTTTLAHSSGEWVASQWPVCHLVDIASPHRMGAALTYARRYALFTLVGIAGEDDLDAPDLCAPVPGGNSSVPGVQVQPKTSGNGRMSGAARAASSIVLPIEQSAALRDRLVKEIAGLESQDGAAVWAREALSLKNRLSAADAQWVETGFALKVSAFPASDGSEPSDQALLQTTAAADTAAAADVDPAAEPLGPTGSTDGHARARIDKSVLTVSTPRRYRNKAHLRFVAQQPCLLCGRKPSDAHHLQFVQPRALGRKASDEFAVPLCRTHHRAAHRAGDERAWWKSSGIDPIKVARTLWKETRANKGQSVRQRPQHSTTGSQAPQNQPNADGPDSKAP
jgi:ERF superfamily